MGQYHHPVNMELKEHIYSHNLGCGLKMGEILWSCYSVIDAVAIMLTHNERPTQQPGDLFKDGVTGRWAGHPILYIGDYGGDGDLPSWRWDVNEEDLYDLLGGNEPDENGVKPEWAEVSELVKSVIERYSGYAFSGNDVIKVQPRPEGGYTVEMPADANHYLRQRIESQRGDVESRSDLTFVKPEEFAIGQRRLIVNLDKLEYVDPEVFGETPTLAGMLAAVRDSFDNETWSSVQAMNAMLFHNGARGGGDDEGEMVGRWRGDRIVIIGEQETTRFPSIGQVVDGYENISQQAKDGMPG